MASKGICEVFDCELGCGEVIDGDKVEQHTKRECKMRLITCPRVKCAKDGIRASEMVR